MTKPALEPLTQDHLERAVYTPEHAAYALALGEWREGIEASMVRGGGVALVHGEDILAMAGVNVFWRGVGHLWMRTCVQGQKRPVAIYRATCAFLSALDGRMDLRRIQAHVRADCGLFVRWARRFGFSVEALMTGYGPEGADYYLMARVR